MACLCWQLSAASGAALLSCCVPEGLGCLPGVCLNGMGGFGVRKSQGLFLGAGEQHPSFSALAAGGGEELVGDTGVERRRGGVEGAEGFSPSGW